MPPWPPVPAATSDAGRSARATDHRPGRRLVAALEPLGRLGPGQDPLGQLDLERRVEQLDLADLLQVGVHRIGRGPAKRSLPE